MSWLCSLPWVGFSNTPTGTARPCCLYKEDIEEDSKKLFVQETPIKEIHNSKYMQSLRASFRNGEKPPGCAACIQDESVGLSSKRQRYLTMYPNVDYSVEPAMPTDYHLILSNACNLKCRSCGPSHSNQWQAEYVKLYGHAGILMPHGMPAAKSSVLWGTKEEWAPHVTRIEVVGGEPFYIKQWLELWDFLINAGFSKNITIALSTNCVIYNHDALENLLKNFKYVSVALSIDGTNEVFEYLRHPGKWDKVSANAVQYSKLIQQHPANSMVAIHCTISWLNALELHRFHQWVFENMNEVEVWHNLIHQPDHMALYMLPPDVKQQLDDEWSQLKWFGYARAVNKLKIFMNSKQPSADELQHAYKKFLVNDAVRNETLLSVIPPQWQPIISEYIL